MDWLRRRAQEQLTRVSDARAAGLYPYFRPFASGGLRTTIDGHRIVNFSSNDYLGMTREPTVLTAAHAAIDRFGCGLSASRVQATTTAHVDLEARLAAFFGFERALVTTTGYQAVIGLLLALADRETTIAVDTAAHASIVDGAFFAAGRPAQRAEVRFFNHSSSRGLERVLTTRERPHALVVVEGVYSLDGDVAPLPELAAVCERHEAVLIVDDAHGSGTLGPGGRGTIHHSAVEGRVPLVVTSLSKSFGAIGGVVLGPADVVDLVKHQARPFLFSAALPAPLVAAAAAALGMLEADGDRVVRQLQQASAYLRSGLIRLGFDPGVSATHIMPVLVGDGSDACACTGSCTSAATIWCHSCIRPFAAARSGSGSTRPAVTPPRRSTPCSPRSTNPVRSSASAGAPPAGSHAPAS